MTVIHQPAGSLLAKLRIKRTMSQLATDLGKRGFIVANLLKREPLPLGLYSLTLATKDQHALVAVFGIKRINAHSLIKVLQRRIQVSYMAFHQSPCSQNHRIARTE